MALQGYLLFFCLKRFLELVAPLFVAAQKLGEWTASGFGVFLLENLADVANPFHSTLGFQDPRDSVLRAFGQLKTMPRLAHP